MYHTEKTEYFYDNYPRDIKVFAGEYASRLANDNKPNYPQANSLESAVTEAAYMTGLERNADVVYMASYAPLFARNGYTQWSPDMIWFDGRSSYGTPSYYTQQMYSCNTGDYTLESTVTGNTGDNKLYQSVSLDEETGDIIIKLVNAEPRDGSVSIDLSAFDIMGKADITVLSDKDKTAYNSIDDMYNVVPTEIENETITTNYDYTLPANLFTVIRAHTRTAQEPEVLQAEIARGGDGKITAVYTVPEAETRALTGYLVEYDGGRLVKVQIFRSLKPAAATRFRSIIPTGMITGRLSGTRTRRPPLTI